MVSFIVQHNSQHFGTTVGQPPQPHVNPCQPPQLGAMRLERPELCATPFQPLDSDEGTLASEYAFRDETTEQERLQGIMVFS